MPTIHFWYYKAFFFLVFLIIIIDNNFHTQISVIVQDKIAIFVGILNIQSIIWNCLDVHQNCLVSQYCSVLYQYWFYHFNMLGKIKSFILSCLNLRPSQADIYWYRSWWICFTRNQILLKANEIEFYFTRNRILLKANEIEFYFTRNRFLLKANEIEFYFTRNQILLKANEIEFYFTRNRFLLKVKEIEFYFTRNQILLNANEIESVCLSGNDHLFNGKCINTCDITVLKSHYCTKSSIVMFH